MKLWKYIQILPMTILMGGRPAILGTIVGFALGIVVGFLIGMA